MNTEPAKEFLMLGDYAVRLEDKAHYEYNTSWAAENSTNPLSRETAANTVREITMKGVPSSILDIGCGGGLLVNEMSRRGAVALGIDNSIEAIDYAITHMGGLFILCNADFSYPHPDGYPGNFDYVLARQLIEHVRDPLHLLQFAVKKVKAGGIVRIETPNLNNRKHRFVDWDGGTGSEDHQILFTASGLKALMQEAGLVNVRVRTRTFPVNIFNGMAAKFLGKTLAKQSSLQKARQLSRSFLKTKAIRIFTYPLCRLTEINNGGYYLIGEGTKEIEA